jgi:bacterioferritin-associated ferredoxin
MYVCVCNAITDKQIRRAARSGVSSLYELRGKLGVAAGCGSCALGNAMPQVYIPSPA